MSETLSAEDSHSVGIMSCEDMAIACCVTCGWAGPDRGLETTREAMMRAADHDAAAHKENPDAE